MNKLVNSALALTLAGVPAMAADSGWSGLDQQIDSLSASLSSAQAGGGPKIGGFLITSYRNASDVPVETEGTPSTVDISGFFVQSARIEVTGDLGEDYSYKMSFDLVDGVILKDAWVKWKIVEQISGKAGRFKMPTLRSSLVSENRLFFLQRSVIGEAYSLRDEGAQVSGNWDMVNWWLTVQNGVDDVADELFLGGRVELNLMGKGVGSQEGAMGSSEENNLSLGLAYLDDGAIDNGTAIGFDACFTAGPFSASAEIVDQDTGIGDNTPWDVMGSFVFHPQYEGAVRYEDLDDVDNTTVITLGVNRYVKGHDIKWGIEYATVMSDIDALEIDTIALGLNVTI